MTGTASPAVSPLAVRSGHPEPWSARLPCLAAEHTPGGEAFDAGHRDQDYGVLEEIATRVKARQEADGGVLPPLLLLGVMERVGSNWVSDTLRPVTGQHNEPFRQQLSPGHPLSALNSYAASLADAAPRLGPYGRHWLVTFAVSKYAPVRQVVKETNLFFALPALLALFPDALVAVLARSPLGVTSSFARGDLFRRWDYAARYQQMLTITSRPEHRRWAGVVPDDNPPDLVALARLQILNTLLLANELHGRGEADGLVVIHYETAVLDPGTAHACLARVVPEAPSFTATPAQAIRDGGGKDTFATTMHKTGLTACLDQAAAGAVRAATAQALAVGRYAVPAPAWDLAREWADGGHLYSLTPRPRSESRPPARRAPEGGGRSCPIKWVPGRSNTDLRWRNLLVSNDEFAAFLNELAAAGLANCHDGSYLLACEMPHERGGRLHRDQLGRWTVSLGFGHHPAYWVTWTGAAAFAACRGARLPTRAELVAETGADDLMVTNCGYQAGDTTPVTQPGHHPGELHHLVGNVQIWCADGPVSQMRGPAARWLHGAAWNTPATPAEIHRPRARHLSGASRGVGIRLVRAGNRPAASAAQISGILRGWAALLPDRGQPLHTLDEGLASALAGLSQPDGGLRAHVGARCGETGRG